MVSVIIPAYNCQAYVAAAIRSVLQQRGVPTPEIIIVDDGSTDDTVSAIDAFGDQVTLIRQENHGVSAARNRGIAAATHDWIAFLDADDTWHPDRLKLQSELAARTPDTGLVFSDFAICDEHGDVVKASAIKTHYPIFATYGTDWLDIFCDEIDLGTGVRAYCGMVHGSLFLGNFVNTSSVLVKRAALEESGTFNEAIKTQEDYDLWLRIARTYVFGMVDAPLVNTRRRPQQMTSRENIKDIVENALEVVERNAPRARQEVGSPVVEERLANMKMSLGIVKLGKGERKGARKEFVRAWWRQPTRLRPILLYLWGLLPNRVDSTVRREVARYRGFLTHRR